MLHQGWRGLPSEGFGTDMAAHYSGIVAVVWNFVQGYDWNKYWKMREYAVSHNNFKAWYYLYRIKKIDARHLSSFGTHVSFPSARFAGKPMLPHGLNGIIINNDVVVGKNCTIYHQVTIGGGNGGAPVIGDNVFIGAGAKIIGPVHIGNNVKIGAGCIVAEDIPDDVTVVMERPRIIIHEYRAKNEV